MSAALGARGARAARARARASAWPTRGGCFIGASLSCADLLVHLYAPRAARLAATRSPTPTATTCSSPRATTCPRSTARWPSSASSRASGCDDHLDAGRRALLAPEPRRARRRVPLRLARPPARGGRRHRAGHPAARRAEPRLRRARRRRARRGLGLGGVPGGERAPARQPGRDRRPQRLPGQRAATEELVPLEPLAAKFEAFGWDVPSPWTATTSRRSTTRFAACRCAPRTAHRDHRPTPCAGEGCPAWRRGPTAGSSTSPPTRSRR